MPELITKYNEELNDEISDIFALIASLIKQKEEETKVKYNWRENNLIRLY